MSVAYNILAGDIGGTNSRLTLVEIRDNQKSILAEATFKNKNYNCLTEVIKHFISISQPGIEIYAACLAVAGPVVNKRVSITNLPWSISEKELGVFLNTPRVKLINDFISVAYGIATLKSEDICLLQKGRPGNIQDENKSIAVIGAGTGLGAAHLLYSDNHYQALSSEAGHAGFAPETTRQTALLSWLQEKVSHVSLEMVLSGRGLVTIYQFLNEVEGIAESESVKKAMLINDPPQVISEFGLKNYDRLCQETLELFVDIYGAASGNIVLHYFPLSEVYIAGGIAAKIKEKIIEPRFIKAFTNKGLMSENMSRLSIKLVLNDKIGVMGALEYIQRQYNKG